MESWRWHVLRHWLAGRRNGVGLAEMLKVVCDPTLGRRARRYLDRIELATAKPLGVAGEAGTYWRVFLRGLDRPLFFPQSAGMFCLEMLVVELFEPANWHYYQIEPTRVRPDDVVLDGGAAEGLFTLQVEPVCRKVYAAEPSPMWIEALHKTFAGSEKVEILPYALSDTVCEVELLPGLLDSSITERGDGTAAEARTVDSLFADRGRPLTYIKGDLEGAEPAMLRGAARTIQTYTPRIAITTYHQADHATWITEFLRGVNPRYRVRTKGIEYRAGAPVMLHAWVE